MATSSLSLSPAFTCFVCQMFGYSSASFSDNGTCNKCSLFVVLEARLRTVKNHLIASPISLVSAQPPSVPKLVNPVRRPLEEPEQP